MKKLGLVVAILITFLIGCGAGTVVQQVLVPPAQARINPQRWQYHCEKVMWMAPEELTLLFNRFGAEGWELSMPYAKEQGGTLGACFKRPL